MDTKYFATTCEFMLHEDDWNEGEGKLISRWDEADCMESADTIEGVLEQVNYLNRDAFGKKPINEVFENDPCTRSFVTSSSDKYNIIWKTYREIA